MSSPIEGTKIKQNGMLTVVTGTFSALKHRNYRLWFTGQLVSLVGTWMQTTAQGYLIYQITKSPVYLGYVSFASGMPSWLFTLYAGVIGDRMSRRTLLVITQTSMMVLAFILAGLVFEGSVQPWHVLVLSFLLGVANAFDAPSRLAFVVELVDREDLTNAIALNSTMFNAATVVGPAVAGITYAVFGAGWCFTINGLSFLAVIAALLMMRLKPFEQIIIHSAPILEDIKAGFSYVRSNSAVGILILNLGVLSMFGNSLVTLIPDWAVNVLGGDVTTNSALLSFRGAGALIGALLIATLSRYGVKGKLWSYGTAILPISMIFFAFMRWIPLSLFAVTVTGLSYMLTVNTTNALVQTQVPDYLRSRVMGIYTLIFFGGMPLGSLLIGFMASSIGETQAVIVSAVILAAFAFFIWFRKPELRKMA
ncbi:MAG TPA: MFS transporter [Anaerolineaceae bacterium]|nr:MFS transporter [Anaerolineaceae bacterium]